jgi:hypothetical protein
MVGRGGWESGRVELWLMNDGGFLLALYDA